MACGISTLSFLLALYFSSVLNDMLVNVFSKNRIK